MSFCRQKTAKIFLPVTDMAGRTNSSPMGVRVEGAPVLFWLQRLLPALGRPVALGSRNRCGGKGAVIPNSLVLQSNDTHFKSNWKEMLSGSD